MEHQIRIGTSGWSYKHWRNFYPDQLPVSGQFPYYLQHFNTVEINNSFYRLPSAETFSNWKNQVPADFTFAVKASRFITHMKKLKDPVDSLHNFLQNVVHLGEKLGVVLFQLPPTWKINAIRLHEFLRVLPAGIRYVFEFRNETWYVPEIYTILREFNCSFCIYELAGHITPFEITADFVYVRLHGPGGKYQGSYPDEALQFWADEALQWAKQRDVYFYFDNDEQGSAAKNALRFQELNQ